MLILIKRRGKKTHLYLTAEERRHTLQIFSEEANEHLYTDFCSEPVTMTVTVSNGSGTVSDFGGTAKGFGNGTARPRRNLMFYLAAGLILNVFGLYFAEVYYQWRNGIRTPGWQKILLTGFVLFNMVMCTIFGGLPGMLSGIFVFGILLLIPFCLKKYFPRQTDM